MKFRPSTAILIGLLAIAPANLALGQAPHQAPPVELAPSNWQSFVSKQGQFTVLAPATPQAETTSTPVAGKTLTWQVAKIRSGQELYAVAYTDLPLAVLAQGREAVLNGLKNRLLANDFDWSAIAARGHRISLGDIPGMEYLSLRNGKVSALRLYLVNLRLYGVFATASSVNPVNHFMDSFQVASIWQPFTSQAGKFTVKFPMAPIATLEAIKTPKHSFSWRKFEARNLYAKEDSYIVAYADLPEKLAKAGTEAALETATKETLTALGLVAMAGQGRAIALNGLPGREFMGTTQAGRSLTMRFYLSGNRLYGVFVGTKSLDTLQEVLNSFQIL